MDTLFILGAKYLIVIPVLITLWVLYKQPRTEWKRAALHALAILVLSFVMAKIAGHFYTDTRPFVSGNFTPLIPHAADNGFPSDHMLLASALAAVVMCYRKRLGYALWAVAIIIGISRVYVGVHHPIDIVGSALIALLAAFIVHIVEKRMRSAIIHV